MIATDACQIRFIDSFFALVLIFYGEPATICVSFIRGLVSWEFAQAFTLTPSHVDPNDRQARCAGVHSNPLCCPSVVAEGSVVSMFKTDDSLSHWAALGRDGLENSAM